MCGTQHSSPKSRSPYGKRQAGSARLLEGTLQPREMVHVALELDALFLDVVPFHRPERIVVAVDSEVIEIRPVLEV
jgi:hypothetical protein